MAHFFLFISIVGLLANIGAIVLNYPDVTRVMVWIVAAFINIIIIMVSIIAIKEKKQWTMTKS